MPRPRIRFQHQELDLPLGVTLIGRDLDCQVTLDDPLVSRRHARIVVGTDRVVVEDLGSRNGVLLNGTCIRRPTPLRNADRLYVGAQCFVYSEVDEVPPSMPSRPTAELGLCASCRLPYPLKAPACPACGATERVRRDEDPRGQPPAGRPSAVQTRAVPSADDYGPVMATLQPPRPPADTVEEIPAEPPRRTEMKMDTKRAPQHTPVPSSGVRLPRADSDSPALHAGERRSPRAEGTRSLRGRRGPDASHRHVQRR